MIVFISTFTFYCFGKCYLFNLFLLLEITLFNYRSNVKGCQLSGPSVSFLRFFVIEVRSDMKRCDGLADVSWRNAVLRCYSIVSKVKINNNNVIIIIIALVFV